ncbi:MAG: MmcB family DNA repair protein, partial [Methylobacteriaceae bacterium]|nr:MmcB family DNA repair protein [Methylobacteriaceae bacterium]
KWPDYAAFCDAFLFAVPADFPVEILPEEAGLVLADGYGASLVREPPEHRLAPARRRAVTLGFAHAAANRHHALVDPVGARGWMD